MSKRTTGAIFISTSFIIYSLKYMTTAIFAGSHTMSEEWFSSVYSLIDRQIPPFEIILIILGVGYLIWGEFEEGKRKMKDK
ncbi:Rad3-related DNA helicase [Gracilibacillus halophilus YIM-C55.5]|uniref:Rad3-related DNA helicase n=1 Tax=Gracilibacillus halophilus YIM-C55.5 TaxID=1308866 RepID=N4W9G2_9BACI|nr:Rad3-related DNA helicase [Gracilibacillus halophilus YIM-C55.5]